MLSLSFRLEQHVCVTPGLTHTDNCRTNLGHVAQEGDLHLLTLGAQSLEQRSVWPLGVEDEGLVPLQRDQMSG